MKKAETVKIIEDFQDELVVLLEKAKDEETVNGLYSVLANMTRKIGYIKKVKPYKKFQIKS